MAKTIIGKSKTVATMLLSLLLFLGGLAYNLYICISATKVGTKKRGQLRLGVL